MPTEKQIKWMDLKNFGQAMERVNQSSLDKTSFFYKSPNHETKKNMTMQKLLCNFYLVFYKVLELNSGSSLDRDELKIVMAMALKKNKKVEDTSKFVEWSFDRKEKMTGKREDFITFEEFYKILRN